jgi:hypothetical protein
MLELILSKRFVSYVSILYVKSKVLNSFKVITLLMLLSLRLLLLVNENVTVSEAKLSVVGILLTVILYNNNSPFNV